MKLMRALLVVLLGLAVLWRLPTTTSASDSTSANYVYDGPPIARVDVYLIDSAETRPTRPSDVREAFVPPSVDGRGTSTTPSARSFATEAAGSSIEDLLQPGGSLIGKAGSDETIRELTGGLPDAQAMFEQLSQGGTVVEQTSTITRVELANNGGFVQLRTVMSRSPGTVATIDVNIPGLDITKLKFNP